MSFCIRRNHVWVSFHLYHVKEKSCCANRIWIFISEFTWAYLKLFRTIYFVIDCLTYKACKSYFVHLYCVVLILFLCTWLPDCTLEKVAPSKYFIETNFYPLVRSNIQTKISGKNYSYDRICKLEDFKLLN